MKLILLAIIFAAGVSAQAAPISKGDKVALHGLFSSINNLETAIGLVLGMKMDNPPQAAQQMAALMKTCAYSQSGDSMIFGGQGCPMNQVQTGKASQGNPIIDDSTTVTQLQASLAALSGYSHSNETEHSVMTGGFNGPFTSDSTTADSYDALASGVNVKQTTHVDGTSKKNGDEIEITITNLKMSWTIGYAAGSSIQIGFTLTSKDGQNAQLACTINNQPSSSCADVFYILGLTNRLDLMKKAVDDVKYHLDSKL